MELSLERYRNAALQTSNKAVPFTSNPTPTNVTPTTLTSTTGSNTTSSTTFTENDKRLQPRLLQNMFPGSAILKNDKLHLQTTLNAWYGVPKQNWRLVFRASSNSFSAAAFHRFCDGVAPAYVIAQGNLSNGFIFLLFHYLN